MALASVALASANVRRTPARRPRLLLGVFTALLFTFSAVLTYAQEYTSIVVFGDSLSDTGNVADLTQAKYHVRIPGPDADYTDGRFTDGTDTVPAAHNYFGV
jgi:phospholipase/lecithinase/hemolysin